MACVCNGHTLKNLSHQDHSEEAKEWVACCPGCYSNHVNNRVRDHGYKEDYEGAPAFHPDLYALIEGVLFDNRLAPVSDGVTGELSDRLTDSRKQTGDVRVEESAGCAE